MNFKHLTHLFTYPYFLFDNLYEFAQGFFRNLWGGVCFFKVMITDLDECAKSKFSYINYLSTDNWCDSMLFYLKRT